MDGVMKRKFLPIFESWTFRWFWQPMATSWARYALLLLMTYLTTLSAKL